MNRFWLRRITYSAVTLFVVGCMLYVDLHLKSHLGHDTFFTGYILFTAVVVLAGFHLRKRLNFAPLGSASTWMQVHVYVGLAAIMVFFAHVGMRAPNGVFETALYSVFLLTAASGLLGLYWTRTIPARLTKLREQIIFERIPLLRRQVEHLAQETVLQLASQAPAAAITDWYKDRLIHYLVRPRGVLYYVAPSSRLRNELHRELGSLTRYLSEPEHSAMSELRRIIDQRDDLDYHDAQQRWLKCWLFVHLALTAVLLVLMVLHTVMAHAFSGWPT